RGPGRLGGTDPGRTVRRGGRAGGGPGHRHLRARVATGRGERGHRLCGHGAAGGPPRAARPHRTGPGTHRGRRGPRGGRGDRPGPFVVLESDAARRRLLAAMAEAWSADLRGDGTPEHVIERRLRTPGAVLGEAPVLIVPAVRLRGSHSYANAERGSAEREMFL